MKSTHKLIIAALTVFLAAPVSGAQTTPWQISRQPALSAHTTSEAKPTYQFFSILDGTPKAFEVHHDTQVGTGKPVDVVMFAIELQVMNSDGNFEPEGLIIDNFFTAKAVQPGSAPNPRDAHDCALWNFLVLRAIDNRNAALLTWPYVEFTVAEGARTIQTNEDGSVYWSDDVECWGSSDRFSPF